MYFSFHLIPLFAGSINLALAIFVFFVSPKRRLNQVFCALNMGLAWWNFGVYVISMIHSAPIALIWARGILMGVILLPAMFYHFSIETTGLKGNQRKVLLAYAVAFAFLLINFTPLFIAAVRPYNESFRLISGPAFYVFCAGFFPATALGTVGALFKYIRSPRPSSVRAVKFLLIAVSIL